MSRNLNSRDPLYGRYFSESPLLAPRPPIWVALDSGAKFAHRPNFRRLGYLSRIDFVSSKNTKPILSALRNMIFETHVLIVMANA